MIKSRKLVLKGSVKEQPATSSSTVHSRNMVFKIVQRAKKLGLERLNDTMVHVVLPWH